MSSMNWLGFSLSSQELVSQPASQHHSRLGFSSDEISANDPSGGDCCYLTSDDSAAHSLSLPPSFGMLEAFNRNNNNNNNQETEWAEMKGMGSNRERERCKMSMQMQVMGNSCSSREQEPKLENLLGRHSHSQCYGEDASSGGTGSGTSGSSSSIGLSMIKTWLRNQPTHTHSNNESGSGNNNSNSNNNNINANAHTIQTQTHTLSLSMSTGSSSPVLPLLTPTVGGASTSSASSHNTNTLTQTPPPPTIDDSTLPRKSIDTFGQRTSIYRGVTRHRWTGRYEAHLWDNSCRREGQTRKGRQVYLGGYDKEEKAARAYDLAALKYWGTTTTTNFPISNYEKELEEMKHMTRQEYVASLRRKSSGFSRGASMYRGVTRHHQHGRWQARIGRVAGNKDLYLGTFSTQEEAAEAYDIAAIKFRGLNAVTNFDMSRYDVKSILESSTLPIGGAAKRLKDVDHPLLTITTDPNAPPSTLGDHHHHISQTQDHNIITADSPTWPPTLPFHPPYPFHYTYGQFQRLWGCKQEQQDSESLTDTTTFHQDIIHHHNFLPSNNSPAFLTMDSSSSSHSHSANSMSMGMDIYADADDYNGYGGGYLIPLPTTTDHANQNQRISGITNGGLGDSASAYQTVFPSSTSTDHARNLYYISHAADGAVKASALDQASACSNTWVPTAIPTLAPRSTNMPLCPPPPPFSLLHDQ